MSDSATLWTIAELGNRVASALEAADDYAAPANGQVRAVPDRRTIRYYTTLGLLDRPAAMQGRTALYGPRHLMQIVAIKRLQAEGLSLSRIQQRLAGLGRTRLAALAAVPEPALVGAPGAEPASGRRRPAGGERFWSALPAEPGSDSGPGEPLAQAAAMQARVEPAGGPGQGAVMQARIELAPGVSLAIDTDRPPSAGELADLREAARPLLDHIQRLQRHALGNRRGTTVEPGGQGS